MQHSREEEVIEDDDTPEYTCACELTTTCIRQKIERETETELIWSVVTAVILYRVFPLTTQFVAEDLRKCRYNDRRTPLISDLNLKHNFKGREYVSATLSKAEANLLTTDNDKPLNLLFPVERCMLGIVA